MVCGTCGGAITPGSATCPSCGAAVDTSAGWPDADPGLPPGPQVGGPSGGYPGYPPGTTWPQPPYPPAGTIPAKSYNLDGLASSVVVLLWITAVTSLIGIVFEPLRVIMSLLMLPLTVVFLVWFYRARQNAAFLDWPQRRSPSWAVFAWIAPIAFLWFPYQIMADIFRAGQSPSERAKFPGLLAAWWGCWCLAWFTGYHHVTTSSQGSSSSSDTLSFGGTVPSLAFAVAAAILLALIVKQVSDGPVGGVGKPSATAGWQPGGQAPGSG